MSTKSSQLQIRVSPDQKAALKRLAADAGQSVSAYVLSTVLPASQVEFGHKVRAIRSAADRREAIIELHRYLAALSPGAFTATVREVDMDGFPGILQNQLAALVEDEARVRGAPAPPWVAAIDEPDNPHFAWDLRSLRPHLLRQTPAAYKRRNVYADIPVPLRPTQAHSPEIAPLLHLSVALESAGVIGEVCTIRDAVFLIAFEGKPESRRLRHVFHPLAAFRNAVQLVAGEHGLEPDWLDQVAGIVAGRPGVHGGFYEDPSLRVYSPHPDYVLALRLASLPFEPGGDEHEQACREIRQLLHHVDVTSEHDGRARVAPFFIDRQLPEDLAALLTPESATGPAEPPHG